MEREREREREPARLVPTPLLSMSGLLARAALAVGRTARARAGGGPAKSFWSAGVRDSEGRLFSETPPPPGQKRKWESWEAVW